MTPEEAIVRTISVRDSRREYFELAMGGEYRRDYEAITTILNYIGQLEAENARFAKENAALKGENAKLFESSKRGLLRSLA